MISWVKQLFERNAKVPVEPLSEIAPQTEAPMAEPLPVRPASDIQLEIEIIAELTTEELKLIDEAAAPPYSELPPYEPTLDLKDYQYPQPDLLGNAAAIWEQFQVKAAGLDLPIVWSVRSGEVLVQDLAELKTVLITGTQSTGKSTFLHQVLVSLLLSKHPSQLKLVLVDEKGIEFGAYRYIEKHFLAKLPGESEAVIEGFPNLVRTLNALCIELDNRFELLKEGRVRNIREYNEKFRQRKLNPQKGHQYLPFLALVIDDLAGYVLQGKNEIYLPLERLIKSGYQVGIFPIISTSQFTGEVFHNLTRNIGQKVVFRLHHKDDYKRVLDTVRIDRHLPDGHFLYTDVPRVSTGEALLLEYNAIVQLAEYVEKQRGYPQAYMLPEYLSEHELDNKEFDFSERDPLFEEAAHLIVQNQIASTSLLQRRMKLGYNRAGRLMDQLEAAGVVGANQESKAREVLIKTEADLLEYLETLG